MTVILVVDDDAPQRDILKMILSDEGYQTHVASSGEEALRVAETVEPDVVLTDLRMEHMDGLELMKELKRHKNAPEVIVMLQREILQTVDVYFFNWTLSREINT